MQSLDPGDHHIEGFDVTVAEVAHKGGRTYGFRVRRSLHHRQLGRARRRRHLVAGVDLLFHDAQHRDEEPAMADAYGRSTIRPRRSRPSHNPAGRGSCSDSEGHRFVLGE